MVYCGKPSKACQQCKYRKIRCDFQKECRQCIKARLKCSGPRDSNELVFRDESRAVRRKMLARRPLELSPVTITTPIKDRAKAFFWAHYIDGQSSVFNYVQPLYNTDGIQYLHASMEAVSLAYFSRRAYSVEALEIARHRYIIALQLTNTAIQSSDTASKDTTLLTVLFLDLFERITKSSLQRSECSASHASGLIALATLRGQKQFTSFMGLHMFTQLSTTILTTCIKSCLPVPIGLQELWDKTGQYIQASSPKWQFSKQMMRFVQFQQAIKTNCVSTSDAIISLKNMDSNLNQISTNLRLGQVYDVIPKTYTTAHVYGETFYVYRDHDIHHTWNNIRLLRILINDYIMKLCKELTSEFYNFSAVDYTCEIEMAKNTTISLSEEICAGIPQYTAVSRCPPHPQLSDSSFRSAFPGHVEHNPFGLLHCYCFLFPLYVAGYSSVCPERMRAWIIDQLHFLGGTMHIKDATLVASYLKQQERIDPWSLYSIIGCYSFTT
ncbi:hypothetical protein F5884DRAFT_837869 [Xylogone sp. PMI_703]|nr:hypothetical protein F5884DRAFT_837869 [Xylogone sp. PMI_703]